jgi:mono/diheme cytochrome c family protein
MKALSATLLLLPISVLPSGCNDFRDCSTVDVSAAEALPSRLSETGLYSDISNDVVSDAAVEFTPRFPLWTDGAKKRRWLMLPPGEQVNTQDADDWVFPVGTRTFKDFTRDGVLIETRMNLKTEDGWAAAAYIWNDAGDDALKQLVTAEDAAGTPHDVPGAAECQACHGGRRDFTLGFSATQLDPDTRAGLFAAGVLSEPVESVIQLDATVKEGLGYLHGNCSHCHNSERNEQAQATDCYTLDDNFDLTLPAGLADIENAPIMLEGRFLLGTPQDSDVLDRMSTRNQSLQNPSMPPLGTEIVDGEGVSAVEALIEALPANGR